MSSRVVTETSVRDLGDRKHVVVYTRERDLLARLQGWQSCERVQPYEIWPDATPLHARIVAWDLYFPVSERRRLEAEISPHPQTATSRAPKAAPTLRAGREAAPAARPRPASQPKTRQIKDTTRRRKPR